MKPIVTRAISGAVYVAIMVTTLLAGQVWFSLVCGMLLVLGVLEFARMTGRNLLNIPSSVVTIEDILGGLMLMFVGFVSVPPGNGVPFMGAAVFFWLGGWFMMFFIRCITELYTRHANPLKELSVSVFAQIYLALGLGSMLALGAYPLLVLLILVVIWSNDTGAFLVGCSIGKHRMFERVSPKKSWEGFFGGLAIACVVALLLSWLCMDTATFVLNGWITVLLLAVIVVVFGTWGDLVESLIKRSLHIKDSGNIIPGHGGVLDRIDSLLIAMPVALVYCIATDCFHLFQ